jgi:hypothetical protein
VAAADEQLIVLLLRLGMPLQSPLLLLMLLPLRCFCCFVLFSVLFPFFLLLPLLSSCSRLLL